jgi:hypothetical protein
MEEFQRGAEVIDVAVVERRRFYATNFGDARPFRFGELFV